MHRLLALFIFILTLPGCMVMSYRTTKREPALNPYMSEIEAYYGVKFEGSLEYGKLSGNRVGECVTGVDLIGKYKIIRIKKDFFEKASPQRKMAVLLHEYGHCVLERDHVDTYSSDLCPMTIMHTYLVTDVCYDRYTEYYWEELKR